jgi:hypothetical protein
VFSQQQQQQHVGSIMNSRRSSGCFEATAAANKENQCPLPPPDLSEETLLAPEHNEVLGKLRFISMLVDTIIGRGAFVNLTVYLIFICILIKVTMTPTLTFRKTVVNELLYALAQVKLGSSSRFDLAKNSRTLVVLERVLNVNETV